MKKKSSYILVVVGIALMLLAFVFNASNAIPFQDAPQELLTLQAERAERYKLMFIIGVVVFLWGLLKLWLLRKK